MLRFPGQRRKFFAEIGDELVAFAEIEFRLGRIENGVTVRSMLEGLEERRQLREPDYRSPELEQPPLPDELAYLWGWFGQLESARSSNGYGPNPLTYAEIKAWAALTGARPAPWEVGLLKRLDAVYLVEMTRTKPPPKP